MRIGQILCQYNVEPKDKISTTCRKVASNQSFFITVFHQNDNFFIKSQNYEKSCVSAKKSEKSRQYLLKRHTGSIFAPICEF